MNRFHAIIFDLGGVLIDWDPRYVFTESYFGSIEKQQYFLENICTSEWNENQDAGYPIAKATDELITRFPEWESAIRDYYGRWEEMLRGPIEETVEIFRELKQNPSLKFYALTNWSAELFPVALQKYEFLHWFDGRVVSGEEKTRKPFPEIYLRLLQRYHIQPAEALFIDDNLRNVNAAMELGIPSIHIQSPEQLRNELQQKKLL